MRLDLTIRYAEIKVAPRSIDIHCKQDIRDAR